MVTDMEADMVTDLEMILATDMDTETDTTAMMDTVDVMEITMIT